MTQRNRRVVFVCEHGGAKSVVAQAYFNQMASELGLSACAISRGLTPYDAIPPAVNEGLTSDGLPSAQFTPQQLSAADLDGTELVVTFDQPSVAQQAGDVPVQDWVGVPAVSDGYETARDSIRSRVRALVQSLADAGGLGNEIPLDG